MAERILGDVLRMPRGSHSFLDGARSGKTSVLIKKVLHRGGGRPEPISCSSPQTRGCSRGVASSPTTPRTRQGPDTGFNGLETNWRLEGGGCLMPLAPNRRLSELSRRPQDGPATPQCLLPVPWAPAVTHGASKGFPSVAPTCPSQAKAASGWAGNLCVLRQRKRQREFRGAWGVQGTGPRALRLHITFSPRRAAQCPTRLL